MVLGIGVDIVETERIKKLIERPRNGFIKRCFTESEIQYCNSKYKKDQHFAGKFSAKEAIFKALKLKWSDRLSWKDIEIINKEDGIPEVKLSSRIEKKIKALNLQNIFVSISHCKKYATATAVVTGGN